MTIAAEDPLLAVRQQRSRRARAGGLLASVQPPAQCAERLTWAMLLDVPEWCHWPEPRRARLVLIAGALFAAPAMRKWIEARRIDMARTLVGADVFEWAISRDTLPRDVPHLPADQDVGELLSAAGAGVLLASLPHACLRDWLTALLPPAMALPPQSVAVTLALDAVGLLSRLESMEETS